MNLRQIERVVHPTALGIQFWDAATDMAVTTGLYVTAQLLSSPPTVTRVGRPRVGRPNQSGVYAFPGLHPGERTASDIESLTPLRAVVDVEDTMGRFLPASFEAEIPVCGPFRGRGAWLARPLMLPEPTIGQERGVGLWSAPQRPTPAGLTTLYASVVIGDAAANPPLAPFALVTVFDAQNRLHAAGLTDERGLLTLPLAFPRLPALPSNGVYPALGELVFDLTVRVAYRAAQPRLPGSRVPDLVELLGQPEVQVAEARDAATGSLTLVDALPVRLRYDSPLVLRTGLAGTSQFESVLRVQP
jgi:hypothetical protein